MEVISKYGKLGCFLGSSDYNHIWELMLLMPWDYGLRHRSSGSSDYGSYGAMGVMKSLKVMEIM